ncbi:PREDICTED: uncharacterized protein LOC108775813 [Cyphomyrmex costatus]|uniref:Tf2-1-like SH3-like domain-containing protein n=1 Tax=Cyphomyrmex costatus TaxID=456900 RepID=A0A151IGM8_9HYME|nr:PREDICTED: uncharacterized protein LOC108775813 [Cyphomyrmex costatus]KYN00535.1 hypothetical protein ALC62_08690 [Cyphomyrmex costatus]
MQQASYCLGFDQSLTPVYHPEANPVERKNRNMKVQLSILVGNSHTEWASKLLSIRYAMNTSVSQSTKNTPAFLTFAREMRDSGEIQRDLREIVIGENFVSEITPYLLKIADTMKEVTETHEQEQDRRKLYADSSRRPAQIFQEGDRVMVKTRTLSNMPHGITSKFAPKRDEPYRIAKRVSPTSYQLADNVTGNLLSVYHVSDLDIWRSDTTGKSSQKPVRTIRKRGRPRKDANLSTPSREIGSSLRAINKSKGEICNVKGPVTRARALDARSH